MEMTRLSSAQSKIWSQDLMSSQPLVAPGFLLHPKQLWRLCIYKAMYSDARVGRMLWLGMTTGKSCEETIIKSKIGNGIFCQVSRYWRKRTGQGQCLDSIYMLNHGSTQRANFFCSNSDQFVRNTAWTPPYCTKASAWHSMRANTCSSSEPVLNWHSWHHWSKQQSCFGLEH